MTETPDHFKALLAAFKELPPTPQRDPTTLELSGYPHLENVYSNILAFFLDPEREHGFGPLFLDSLLSVAGCEAIQDGEEVEVNREEVTGTRKQIDLVISTDTLIVGIENKIYHPLHNDLEDYGWYLAEKANGRRVCKILLGLNLPNDDTELSCFKPITYEAYFDEILRRIGPALIGSQDRYLRFLLEVIETVNHLTEGSAMDPEMLAFFKNYEEDVESLLREANTLKRDMRNQVNKLPGVLDISDSQDQDRPIEVWPHRESGKLFDILVHNITIEEDFVLAIDTVLSLEGWRVEVFDRKGKEGNFQRIKSWIETQERCWKENRVSYEQPRFILDLSADLPYKDSPDEAFLEAVAAQVRPILESAMDFFFDDPAV